MRSDINDEPIVANKKKIALTGATGYVGGRLLKVLLKKRCHVRCLTRYPQNLKGRFLENEVEIVQADLLDPESLVQALQGVDCAYYFVHSMGARGSFFEKDRKAAENFGKQCSLAGVKTLIYLGGLGDSSNHLSEHLKSRQEVGQILREHAKGVQVIEFRASIVIGSGSLSFEMIRSLCEKLPVMITPRWVDTLLQPIAISDLLRYLEEAAERQDLPANPIFEIGGKDQVTYRELMEEYSKQKGLRRLMIPVPVLSPYLSSLWLGLVTPLYARVGRKIIESATTPTVVHSPLALQYFAIKPMGCKEAIEAALRYEDSKFSETRWIDSVSTSREVESEYQDLHEKHRLQDTKTLTVNAAQKDVFSVIEKIGGDTGYYYGNWMWHLRGFLDLLVGGVGFRRGRKDPEHLNVGDVLDFWRVEEIQPGKKLLLRAEMKVPGRAWLEFKVEGYQDLAIIKQRAIFDPSGLGGILYWYLLFPIHHFVFLGMLKGIRWEATKQAALGTQGKQGKQGKQGGSSERLNRQHYLRKTAMPVPAKELFDWHKRPGAFQRLLPPGMDIEIIKYTGGITDGNEAIICLKKGFIKVSWHLKHLDYIEGKQFRDKQVQGPFAFWDHRHLIEPLKEHSSELIDSIEYQLRGGKFVNGLLGYLFYQQLDKLFEYRHEVTKNDLIIHHQYQGNPMKILIAGSSGLIGKNLCAFLSTGGHQVFKLVRNKDSLDPDEIAWDPTNGRLDKNSLEGFDAVINLAGETIAQKWTPESKRRILQSREATTRLLANTLADLSHPPKVFINSSAIGIYGSRGNEELTENSSSGQGFLAEVCKRWEGATEAAKNKGIRVVLLRTGIVLTPQGGALAKMLLPFKLGLGGKVGEGTQYWSWIALEDLLGIIHFALTHPGVSGPVNAVSPHPVTSEVFAKTLGEVLSRPAFLPLPVFAVNLMLGSEAANDIMLSSQKVKPEKLIHDQYNFLYPELEGALRGCL